LGMLFSRSAHSPVRDAPPRGETTRRCAGPSSRASARSASLGLDLGPLFEVPCPRTGRNHPPSLKPSSPSGSWTTPSSEVFRGDHDLFPCRFSFGLVAVRSAVEGAGPATPGNWARAGRPVRPLAGVYVEVMTTELIAPGADRRRGTAFRELTGPVPPGAAGALLPDARLPGRRRGRPAGHACWAAWQGLGAFEGARLACAPGSTRSPPTGCLKRRARRGQPAARPGVGTSPGSRPPEPTRLGEVAWIEPYPDVLLEGAAGVPPGPEARYEQAESISLAFVTALQAPAAPPGRRPHPARRPWDSAPARWPPCWTSTVESVTSALKRARASPAPPAK